MREILLICRPGVVRSNQSNTNNSLHTLSSIFPTNELVSTEIKQLKVKDLDKKSCSSKECSKTSASINGYIFVP